MNITLVKREESILKCELENAIKFNNKLFKDISGPSFLQLIMGRYNGVHLITLDHLITKYEQEQYLITLQKRVIEKLNKFNLSMTIVNIQGLDFSIIKQLIAETEAELVELVKEIDNNEEE